MPLLLLLSETHGLAPAAAPATLIEKDYDSLIVRALDRMHRGEYSAADSSLASGPDRQPWTHYFRGLVAAARCADLGDTAALTRAESEWNRIDTATDALARGSHFGLYQGLSQLQLSYVAGQRGAKIKSARLGRRAAKTLEGYRGFPEARAALALFEYYKADLLKSIAWVPFVNADKDAPLQTLTETAPTSHYLSDLLTTSLMWIHYDAGRYDAGLPAIHGFLARYPGNREYRAMLADFQFRKGRLDSALAIHLALAAEYQALGEKFPSPRYLPIGYLCSVGNLAKIYAAQKRPDLLNVQLEIWLSSRYVGMMGWLPPSLVREVATLKKENMRQKASGKP